MVLVRFASRCDVVVFEHLTDHDVPNPCGNRSLEYTEWPTCRVCLGHVCREHAYPGSTFAGEGKPTTCLCRDCGWADFAESRKANWRKA